ncbi:hypothetical protein DFR55_1032 [Herbinix hemicellulosilytica]|uniref:Uncharacterized protein n=1 Tax=Herbinix hemicellulosilytica TaxID=1564487 RepID=A0A0H5STV5_HERHM|nr:hypothetical protein [Herbinix hemicellulosilytica]RBP60019.1 hypothetical protein DFR55_1032 [Herbinix hemicellulosilytica]CRZ33743.1 hypothetical protein HHT355_0538 [Herbinix hemicellulosilytica]
MNKCKLCKKEIPDGTEYCIECMNKKDFATDESYLDNLLNSILEETITARDVYKTQAVHEEDSLNGDKTADTVDLADLYDFEQFDFTKDLDEPVGIKDDISNEDLLSSDKMTEDDLVTYENDEVSGDVTEDTDITFNKGDYEDKSDMINRDNFLDLYNNIDSEFLQAENQSEELNSDENGYEYSEGEDEAIDLSIDELMKQIDLADEKNSSQDTDKNSNFSEANINEMNVSMTNDLEKKGTDDLQDNNLTPEDELLSLLNQFDPEDPVASDIQSITELLGGLELDLRNDKNNSFFTETKETETKEPVSANIPTEVQDDKKEDDNGIRYITQDFEDDEKNHKESKKKVGKAKKKNGEPKEKKGIFQRIFGNIKDDNDDNSSENQSPFFEMTDETDIKEEKKDKKKKKKTGKKAAKTNYNDEDDLNSVKDDTESVERKKAKKAKKEKKKKEKAVIFEEEIDEGRINKVGASIVFLFFGIIVAILITSTNTFSYRQSIGNASKYFDRKDYAQAYNEIIGLDLKDEDIELYNKIKTVSIVYKQLESYYNYYNLRKFPEALDSLLKGLKRYDKYIELATMLGIKEDMDYIRSQIVDELYHVFSLTEKEALDIISLENKEDYSVAVYEAVNDIIAYY